MSVAHYDLNIQNTINIHYTLSSRTRKTSPQNVNQLKMYLFGSTKYSQFSLNVVRCEAGDGL